MWPWPGIKVSSHRQPHMSKVNSLNHKKIGCNWVPEGVRTSDMSHVLSENEYILCGYKVLLIKNNIFYYYCGHCLCHWMTYM